MASQAITRRLAVLEASAYEPIIEAAYERFGARAGALWSLEEQQVFYDTLAASNELTPAVLARIETDDELSALWREICRIGWLQFYSQTGSITSEHEYFS